MKGYNGLTTAKLPSLKVSRGMVPGESPGRGFYLESRIETKSGHPAAHRKDELIGLANLAVSHLLIVVIVTNVPLENDG